MNYEQFLGVVRGLAQSKPIVIRVETVDGESPQPHVSTYGWDNLPSPYAEAWPAGRDRDEAMYEKVRDAMRSKWRCAALVDTFERWWPLNNLRRPVGRRYAELVVSVYEAAEDRVLTLKEQALIDTTTAPLVMRLPLELLTA